jgi:hypothetical protein
LFREHTIIIPHLTSWSCSDRVIVIVKLLFAGRIHFRSAISLPG